MKTRLRTFSTSLGLLLIIAYLPTPRLCAATNLFVLRNSFWKYNNLNQDLGTAWLNLNYDDSGWTNAIAPLGDNVESGVQQITEFGGTVIDIGPLPPRYPTIYFRKSFVVTNVATYEALVLRIMRDDAAFVYLNGYFLIKSGCAGDNETDVGYLPHTDYCCVGGGAVSGTEEITYYEYRLATNYLVEGTNIFAVEGRQQAPGSSDFAFDLEAGGIVDTTPPMLSSIDPLPGSVLLNLSYITVGFDSDVTGVDASDLLIANAPATNMVVISPREYTFYFPPPPTGSVQVTWASNHGITDTAALHNPYTADTWGYTYDPHALVPASVYISEFMANNNSGIRDEDGMRSDWIELNNAGDLYQNLEGWFLTDDATNLTKWRFPAVVIQPHQFVIVWASGKNRTDPTRPLHTNFKLDHNGEYLALLDANTNIISEFAPAFPPQQPDISYGRDAVDPTIVGYFTNTTPGAINSTSGP